MILLRHLPAPKRRASDDTDKARLFVLGAKCDAFMQSLRPSRSCPPYTLPLQTAASHSNVSGSGGLVCSTTASITTKVEVACTCGRLEMRRPMTSR